MLSIGGLGLGELGLHAAVPLSLRLQVIADAHGKKTLEAYLHAWKVWR
jgi:hypothetical protein